MPLPQTPSDVQKLYAPGSFEAIPVDGMRRTIAARLTESKQTVPHFYLSVTCTIDRLKAAREQLNASAPKARGRQAAVEALDQRLHHQGHGSGPQKVPEANVTWAGDAILRHRSSDVGVAVAVEGGLFTPVIRGVETKTLRCHLAQR